MAFCSLIPSSRPTIRAIPDAIASAVTATSPREFEGNCTAARTTKPPAQNRWSRLAWSSRSSGSPSDGSSRSLAPCATTTRCKARRFVQRLHPWRPAQRLSNPLRRRQGLNRHPQSVPNHATKPVDRPLQPENRRRQDARPGSCLSRRARSLPWWHRTGPI
jgi:hypothetical protein